MSILKSFHCLETSECTNEEAEDYIFLIVKENGAAVAKRLMKSDFKFFCKYTQKILFDHRTDVVRYFFG